MVGLVYYGFNLVISYVLKTAPFGKVLSNQTFGCVPQAGNHLLAVKHYRDFLSEQFSRLSWLSSDRTSSRHFSAGPSSLI
jgi:hypothetical protein